MTLLNKTISDTESKYLKRLEEFFSGHYPSGHLVSHGLDHHRRVWSYAKELLQNEKEDSQFTPQFVANLIVACFLHDIGMAKDIGFRHGLLSSKYCRDFLGMVSMEPDYFKDAIESIEHHDEKEYMPAGNSQSLLKYLTAADDLDAYGYIGIYRYLEIYMARGINLHEASGLIMKNAVARFRNFESMFGKESGVVKKHQKRFQILINYFEGLSSEIR
jgi:HD superfamily phosphodiesterase